MWGLNECKEFKTIICVKNCAWHKGSFIYYKTYHYHCFIALVLSLQLNGRKSKLIDISNIQWLMISQGSTMFYGVIKWDALPEFVGAEKAWCIVWHQTGPEGWDQVSLQWMWTAFWMVAYTELAYTVFLTC